MRVQLMRRFTPTSSSLMVEVTAGIPESPLKNNRSSAPPPRLEQGTTPTSCLMYLGLMVTRVAAQGQFQVPNTHHPHTFTRTFLNVNALPSFNLWLKEGKGKASLVIKDLGLKY